MIEILIESIPENLLGLIAIIISSLSVLYTFMNYNETKAKPLVACKLEDAIEGNGFQVLTVYNLGNANAFDIRIDIDPPINTAKETNDNFQTISKLQIPFLLPNEKEPQRMIKLEELKEKTYKVKATYYSKPTGIFKIFIRKTSKSTIDFTDSGRLMNTETTLYHVVQQLEIIAKKFKP